MTADVDSILGRLQSSIPSERAVEFGDLALSKGWLAVEVWAEQREAEGAQEEALHGWVACAIGEGSSHALFRLGQRIGGEDGRRLLIAAADAGEVLAVSLLAERSKGAEAVGWLRRAAQLGDLDAAVGLAERLAESGCAESEAEASCWLELAARYGQPQARYALGAMLVEVGERQEGLAWLRRVALDRSAEAREMLDALGAPLYASASDEWQAFTAIYPGDVRGFDDLAWLDEESLQELIRQSDANVLVLTLRDAAPEVLDAFRTNMSPRAWKYLVREMLGSSGRDVEAVAQGRASLVEMANAVSYRPLAERRVLTQQEIDGLLGLSGEDVRRLEAQGYGPTEMDLILESIRHILCDDDGMCRPRRTRPRPEGEERSMADILASIRKLLEE